MPPAAIRRVHRRPVGKFYGAIMTPEELEAIKNVELSSSQVVQSIYNGTCSLNDFVNKSIIPLVVSTIQPSPHENTLIATYYRLTAWMQTIAILANPIHLQGVCAAARSMFELLMDLKELIKDPSKADAFHDFTFVKRFRIAKMTVEHFKQAEDQTKFEPQRKMISDPDNIHKCDLLREKHWGRDSKGNLIWPDHWSNRDAYSRAKTLGRKYEDIYRDDYGRLSWNIHAGAVGIDGLSPDGIRCCYGWAHNLCQGFMIEATEDIAVALHLLRYNQILWMALS